MRRQVAEREDGRGIAAEGVTERAGVSPAPLPAPTIVRPRRSGRPIVVIPSPPKRLPMTPARNGALLALTTSPSAGRQPRGT